MFEDIINDTARTKDNFSNHVRDSFGDSIVSDVLEPIESEEERLHYEYELAAAKMTEIKMITAELRLIL